MPAVADAPATSAVPYALSEVELEDTLLKLFASDYSSTDGRGSDPISRQRVFGYLSHLDDETFRVTLARLVRRAFLEESALRRGYGVQDALMLARWLARNGIEV